MKDRAHRVVGHDVEGVLARTRAGPAAVGRVDPLERAEHRAGCLVEHRKQLFRVADRSAHLGDTTGGIGPGASCERATTALRGVRLARRQRIAGARGAP